MRCRHEFTGVRALWFGQLAREGEGSGAEACEPRLTVASAVGG